MRLGDLDALKETLCEKYEAREHYIGEKMLEAIDNAPTVEYPFYAEAYQTGYEEGKNDRPQAEWITYDVDITPHPLHCKNCGWSNHHIKNEYIKEFKVCPSCGADMQKGGAEE